MQKMTSQAGMSLMFATDKMKLMMKSIRSLFALSLPRLRDAGLLFLCIIFLIFTSSSNARAASPSEYRALYINVAGALIADADGACQSYLQKDQADVISWGYTPASLYYPTSLAWNPATKQCNWFHNGVLNSGFAHTLENIIAYCADGSLANTGYYTEYQCPDRVPSPDDSNKGNGTACPFCGQPINPANGNMWHTEVDYRSASRNGLALSRTYNSNPYNMDGKDVKSFGVRWTTDFDAELRQDAPAVSGTRGGECWRSPITRYMWCNRVIVKESALPAAVSILRPDGKRSFFNLVNFSYFVGDGDLNDRLRAIFSADGGITGWSFFSAPNSVTEIYDAKGKFISSTTLNGTSKKLTYSDGTSNDSNQARYPADAPVCAHVQSGKTLPGGRLLCVTDSWGRQLHFEYDDQGRISAAIDPDGGITAYEYDGPSGGCIVPGDTANLACKANNLTKVTFPDGQSKKYVYNELARIYNGSLCYVGAPSANGFGPLFNALTGLIDENNERNISWTYDCGGLATSSMIGTNAEKVVLSYGETNSAGIKSTSVVHYLGTSSNPLTTQRNYIYRDVLGAFKNISIDQPCAECGNVASRAYDENGNAISTKDWSGVETTHKFDLSRNLEILTVEAAGTPQARTVTTEWHASLRLPTKIAEPKRHTILSYDASGNVLSRIVQATSDLTGALGMEAPLVGMPRIFRYTYNNLGQVLTEKGPRTDVDETTTYTYDALGNLATIRDAANHQTTLENYDANGRVGRMIAFNGVVTDLTYWPRGWLKRRVVTAGGTNVTTDFEYDGVGQIKIVTLPDHSTIRYDYDSAHRLVGVTDSSGNKISYTYDFAGNRISEQVTDTANVLLRKIARVYDALNLLKQQTGGVQ